MWIVITKKAWENPPLVTTNPRVSHNGLNLFFIGFVGGRTLQARGVGDFQPSELPAIQVPPGGGFSQTHLKKISQIGSSPQVRVNSQVEVNIKQNIWNHRLDIYPPVTFDEILDG